MISTRFFLISACVFFSGCATIFSPPSDSVTISTNPPGAVVFINSQPFGVTPISYQLHRQQGKQSFRLEKEGYFSQDLLFEKEIDPITYLNTVCILCYFVDYASGKISRPIAMTAPVNLAPTNNVSLGVSDFSTMRLRAEKEWSSLCETMGNPKGTPEYRACMTKQQEIYVKKSQEADKGALIERIQGNKAIILDAR